jgi:hypothetical protein
MGPVASRGDSGGANLLRPGAPAPAASEEALSSVWRAGLAAAALAALSGCGGAGPETARETPAEGQAPPRVEEAWAEELTGSDDLPGGAAAPGSGRLAWRSGQQPQWPAAWRLVGSGRFGGADRPVAWLRFEAPGTAVDELAGQAIDALVPIAGDVSMRDLARDATGRRAVAHLRGQMLRASAEASAMEGQSVVSLTIETRPGLLAGPSEP